MSPLWGEGPVLFRAHSSSGDVSSLICDTPEECLISDGHVSWLRVSGCLSVTAGHRTSLGLSWGQPAWNGARKERGQPTRCQGCQGVCSPAGEEIPALLSAEAAPCRSVSLYQPKEEGARAASQGAWEEETGRRPDPPAGSEPRRIMEMDRRERCLPLLATVGNS